MSDARLVAILGKMPREDFDVLLAHVTEERKPAVVVVVGSGS